MHRASGIAQPEFLLAPCLLPSSGRAVWFPFRMITLRAWVATLLVFRGLVVAWGAEPARFSDPAAEAEALLSLVEHRLALMPEVASWKHARGQPVADEAREREVLDRWEASAVALGVERRAARLFMEEQISAARALQEACRADWSAGRSVPPPARDLARDIRPELDEVGVALLSLVRAVAANGSPPSARPATVAAFDAICRRRGVPARHATRLADAMLGLRVAGPATVAGLRQGKVVRVGLTGDYAPFSEERGGELHGLDVDLFRDFAASLGARVAFVRTSWPRLMDDLAAGRFDVAAGGISVTPERRLRADFGPPLITDGKTPIVRREDRRRFVALEEINRPEVRVIVNPGGTNERFARENLPRSSLLVFPDNRAIFGEILAGRADVMVTDGVEVRLQSARHPGLCGTRDEPFTRSDKAWMLPRGAELTATVAEWLRPRVTSGEISRRLESAIAGAR